MEKKKNPPFRNTMFEDELKRWLDKQNEQAKEEEKQKEYIKSLIERKKKLWRRLNKSKKKITILKEKGEDISPKEIEKAEQIKNELKLIIQNFNKESDGLYSQIKEF